MQPENWPKAFTYSPVSICQDIHPNVLRNLLSTNLTEDLTRISTCIEEQKVHPHILIKIITPELKYKGPHPHPLSGLEAFEGHPQHGVFATERIPKNTELGEYVGEIVLSEESSKKTKSKDCVYNWAFMVNSFYLNVYSGKIANELTFVNDYRGLQRGPNVRTTLIIHRGSYYFGYETIEDIEPMQELVLDYGKRWAKSH